MKKVLSVLTLFVLLGSSVPAFACCHGGNNPVYRQGQVQERIRPKEEISHVHKAKKPLHHNGSDVSKVITGAAVGAIIASILS